MFVDRAALSTSFSGDLRVMFTVIDLDDTLVFPSREKMCGMPIAHWMGRSTTPTP